MAGSSQRNDVRRALALERLAKAANKRPDLTPVELITSAVDDRVLAELVEAVERFVLLGPPDPGQGGV